MGFIGAAEVCAESQVLGREVAGSSQMKSRHGHAGAGVSFLRPAWPGPAGRASGPCAARGPGTRSCTGGVPAPAPVKPAPVSEKVPFDADALFNIDKSAPKAEGKSKLDDSKT